MLNRCAQMRALRFNESPVHKLDPWLPHRDRAAVRLGRMDPWARLFRLAAKQYGVVTFRQAQACGIASSTWQRRLADERWERPYPGVAIVPGVGATDSLLQRRVLAAVLASGSDALASHRSAAAVLGFWDGPLADLEVLLPLERRGPSLAGVWVRRTGTLERGDRTRVGPVPVTAPARTVCDLAAVLSDERCLRPVVIAAVQRRRVTLERVAARVERLGRFRGAPVLRRLLAQLDEERCDSELEFLVRRRLREEGFDPLPGTVPVRLRTGRTVYVDIGFAGVRAGIEVDGRVYHTDPADVAADHQKQNELQAVDFRLLRITWLRFDQDWDGFVAELRATLAAANSPGKGHTSG